MTPNAKNKYPRICCKGMQSEENCMNVNVFWTLEWRDVLCSWRKLENQKPGRSRCRCCSKIGDFLNDSTILFQKGPIPNISKLSSHVNHVYTHTHTMDCLHFGSWLFGAAVEPQLLLNIFVTYSPPTSRRKDELNWRAHSPLQRVGLEMYALPLTLMSNTWRERREQGDEWCYISEAPPNRVRGFV